MHDFRKLITLALLIMLSSLMALDITPGQLLFKTNKPLQDLRSDRTGLPSFDSYLNSLGATNLRPIKGMHQDRYYMIDLDQEPNWQDLQEGKLRFAGIEYVQPNYLNKMHLEPNDPLYGVQFHYLVSLPQAWNITTGSDLVLVGVVDSGILRDHPDLMDNIYINPREIPDNGIDDDNNGYIDDWCGWDFVDAPEMADIAIGDYMDQDNDVTDENYHGTHVSGIIGAVGNNNLGISGVAWNVKILPIRAGFRTIEGDGYLQDDDVAAAIIYAADMGCRVINMSWGDDKYAPIIGDACQYAYDKGAVLVASAGNMPLPILNYPAKLGTVISVGAINRSRNLAGFSSYGPDLDLVAPGEMILSTYKNTPGEQYFEMSGTSMSAPYVTGAIALLLAMRPDLSPSEVRSLLLNSTDDLGAPGFDIYYGHGLLNVRKLLESVDPPLIHISHPVEHQSVSSSFDIKGTIQAKDFFRYSVMYASKQIPTTILDWKDVQNHTNQPSYKMVPVENGVLAHFYIPDLLPEGDYLIRIQYENRQGKKYNQFLNVIYNNSLPILRPETVESHKRYDGQNIRYYVTAVFDEAVYTQLKVTASDGSIHYCYGAEADSIQVWALPQTLPEGQISASIRATNASNFSIETQEFTNLVDIRYELIPNYGYSSTMIGNPRIPLSRMHDFNGDGIPEYVAMDLPKSGYGNVKVYQPTPGGHIVTHDYREEFRPFDLGNTDIVGQELLYIRGDTAYLRETQSEHTYPNLDIWSEQSVTGGVIADYNANGRKDILLVRNLPTQNVIQAYQRETGATVTPKNTLTNPTSTSLRNIFVPTIIVENLDGDQFPDILTADTDGDVMIFEIRNDALHELTWHYEMPVGNTYTLAAGDFDGNGRKDFIVGGYRTDIVNPDKSFWYFEGFRNTANNRYQSMGNIMFNNVMTQNGIRSFDLDGDGKDEIILGIPPNLYILKYVDGEFKPVFNGSSMRSYDILCRKDESGRSFFATNDAFMDSTAFMEWTADEPYTGPPPPANFSAIPLDEANAILNWKDSGADEYRVYRKEEDEEPILIATVPYNAFVDGNLQEGIRYQYAVSAVHNGYSPPEGIPTKWIEVLPLPAPQLETIEMTSPWEVKLVFDQRLDQTALMPNRYELSHDIGIPHGINAIATQRGVLLRFSKALPPIDDSFTLTLRQLSGVTGVPVPYSQLQFPYQQDTQAPQITGVTISQDHRSIKIDFNETISSSPDPNHLLNYSLHTPANDPDNSITSVYHYDDSIQLNFAHPLKYSNQAYHVEISNIQDLAGNTISSQHRIARFHLMDSQDLKNLKAFPNPVHASVNNWIAIHNFPMEKTGKISIYNSSGDLVHKSSLGPFKAELGNNIWRWDMKNSSGGNVSSGIYFYVVEMDKEIARGKFAIIR